ncbi:hypothetical protein SAY87_030693 [Trapa incisa]|uniref:Uncharacterized protein n=1 Tax=Trapa incisa TaxID=236973 RepID=A0AAN7QKH1_9MYRT|nr:hypothetical protein SAY87_030693 [Trapa incisa]
MPGKLKKMQYQMRFATLHSLQSRLLAPHDWHLWTPRKGIWNFTNPAVVGHNEILEMYKAYIDLSFEWVNFTLEEQAKVIIAP